MVDGAAVSIHDQFVLLGAMITGIPNFAMAVGYTNASWTLRADLTSRLVCKVLTWMDEQGYASVVPQPRQTLDAQPLLGLKSGYIERASQLLPNKVATRHGACVRTTSWTWRRPCAPTSASTCAGHRSGARRV